VSETNYWTKFRQLLWTTNDTKLAFQRDLDRVVRWPPFINIYLYSVLKMNFQDKSAAENDERVGARVS